MSSETDPKPKSNLIAQTIQAEEIKKREPIEVKILGPRESPIMSYAALVISFTALAVSIFQLVDAREKDRLQFQPDLSFVDSTATTEDRVGLFLENRGLGPAVIKTMTLELDGKSYDNWHDIKKQINNESEDPYLEYFPRWLKLGRDSIMPAGRIYEVYTTRPGNIGNWTSFGRILSQRLRVTIKYCSRYGSHCETVTNNP